MEPVPRQSVRDVTAAADTYDQQVPGAPTRLRQLRAAVFSLVALTLGLLGHGLASRGVCAADLGGCLLVAPLIAGAGWLLAGRERGYLPLLFGTYAVQALLHLVMQGSPLPSAGMLTAHALAGAAAALGLRHGERTITRFGVLRAAGARVLCTLVAIVGLVAALPYCSTRRPAQILTCRTPWRPLSCWTVAAAITRGPPLLAR
jgi:hypothetical protein